MKTTKTVLTCVLSLIIFLFVSPPIIFGEDFPSKPLRLVTPYPPGGSHSLHAGVIATVAEPYFGEPMISIIRAGGGGAVAATQIAEGDADGYTLLFGDPTINSLRPQVEKLEYTVDDFVGVARINYAPAVFVASPSAPFNDFKGMIDYAKVNPNKLVYSNDTHNGFTYTVFEMLKVKTNTEMKGIIFGGGGPAVTQLLGGNTMAYAGAPSVVGEHILGGSLIGICTADTERWPTLPDVPTCGELGVDIVFNFWRGVLVKKGTPEDVIVKLSDGFSKLSQDEGFKRLIGKINSRIDFLGHEQFGAYLEREQKDLKEMYDAMNK